MSKKSVGLLMALMSITFASSVNADSFSKVGKIKRVLTDDQYFSGCMVYLDSAIEHNCPDRWVSLDCKGLFYTKDKASGRKKYAAALLAAQTGKTVQLYINDTQKVNGYCVARRIDLLF